MARPDRPHARPTDQLLGELGVPPHGLNRDEAARRLQEVGPNRLPEPRPASVLRIVLRQFTSPLIYVLLAAALVSLAIGELTDAAFIALVLAINALIGTIQEHSAQRAAQALKRMVTTTARVLREGETWEVDAEELVPGDIVLLESGDRVPADLRLLECHDLTVDESLLTGESLAVPKSACDALPPETPLAERRNMAFAGSLVIRGRGRALVVATAIATELGRIAESVVEGESAQAPLLVRMERFTRKVALVVAVATLLLAAVAAWKGMPVSEIFFMAVALAVSAIPEGLPVALTVALAVATRRMAKRQVIVRRLVAVEALGSCTCIATDKTGTLTVNQLTVRRILLPGEPPWEVTGEGIDPEGAILAPEGTPDAAHQKLLERLCESAVLSNEAFLGRRDGAWSAHGDAVDVALLVMAHKAGVRHEETESAHPELAALPYESEKGYSASLNRYPAGAVASVKGALERVLPMCRRQAGIDGDLPLDAGAIHAAAERLAGEGFRVLAFAAGPVEVSAPGEFGEADLHDLVLLGLVGMIDPLRPEAKAAVAACQRAGIEVKMVTGDHPLTALAIARELGLAEEADEVVTGAELARRSDGELRGRRVFARVEPTQKLAIVQGLQKAGHFVAVTGDGANDAPALRAAEVGVAMGRGGTDVAREAAEIVLADDNFASIVAGVEEGRIAYANVRKVIFLLISTGAAEIVLFLLSLLTGTPLPLVAVQLLWLNLVTNGIQDVALAFEPGEGDELAKPPRPPHEPIFNRLMVERVVVSALAIGLPAFLLFHWLLGQGYSVEEARNGTLLLMVLFENLHVFNSRSETRSAFTLSPLRNPLLLGGTAAAQLIHIGAMYTPGVSDVLAIQPVSPGHWLTLLGIATVVLLASELHKLSWRWRHPSTQRG